MGKKSLILAVDMHGCPNRCRHCWLGHMPNVHMSDDADKLLVDYFRPYFDTVEYYGWLREPDFCDNYRQRLIRDRSVSVGAVPQRFELASFWRLVRDPGYVDFLREVGPKVVQLTFFGMEALTDKYVGRKGAFDELIRATEILLENRIAPRWQAFINEENRSQMVELLELSRSMKLEERCAAFGGEFKFFVHEGSCDGENQKLYGIRIEKSNIPPEIAPYYLNYDEILTERECCEMLKDDRSHFVYHNGDTVTLYVAGNFDVFFNFTHMAPEWKIGSVKTDSAADLARKVIEEDIPALRLARQVELRELVERYGDPQSEKVFSMGDYKEYLLNLYVKDNL